MSMTHWLAQANVAYLLAPHDHASMGDYMARLDEMNALADASPGFVWRYLTDSRDPDQREFDDPLVLFNMSVWRSVEALHDYTYRTAHSQVYAARRRWFAPERSLVRGHALALWWIAAESYPTVAEAKLRLAHHLEHGATPYAFDFKRRFAPSEG